MQACLGCTGRILAVGLFCTNLDVLGPYINNSPYLTRKFARIFVRGHYLFREASFEEQIMSADKYPSIFSPHYPLNLCRNARSFENWGIFSDISQFWLGNIHST